MKVEAYNSMTGTYGGSSGKRAAALSSGFQEYMKTRKQQMPGGQRISAKETQENRSDQTAAYQSGLYYGTYGMDRLRYDYDLWSLQKAYQLRNFYYTDKEIATQLQLMRSFL